MSDHFDGRRFFNPAHPAGRRPWEVLHWALTRKPQPWPKWVEDAEQPGPPAAASPGEIALTFINQSTFLIQMGGLNVLTDPVWSDRASPLSWWGPRRVRRPGLAFERLPEVHAVLASHNHYDHMDLATLRRLQERFHPRFVTGLGNRRYLMKRGLQRVEELDWWQTTNLGDALRVTMTPAQHFSARSLFDRDRTLWGGFALQAEGRTVLFGGDSAYGPHFKEIGSRLGVIDVALLPIGAYEPRWFMKEAHMNPDEAVRAHLDLGARHSIAMHFGTFQLTDEPIDEPVRALRESLAKHEVEEGTFRVLGFGETVVMNHQPGPDSGPRRE
jgi:L-ascorbate metabolism protein UlaG (beta-lactamase superfamily)